MSNIKNKLRTDAELKLREAEAAYINYAMYLPQGRERRVAFEVIEHIKKGMNVFNPISSGVD